MAVASIYDVLTTAWVKAVFLTGVDLTDDSGTAFPDDLFRAALRQAVAQTEGMTGLSFESTKVLKERHDYTSREQGSYLPYYLHRRPVQKIDALSYVYGNQTLVTVPTSWVTVMDSRVGYTHIIPQTDSVSQLLPLLVPSLSHFRRDYVPGWFTFDYTAGFRVFTGTVAFGAGETTKAVVFTADETFDDGRYDVDFVLVSPGAGDASVVPTANGKTPTGTNVALAVAPAAPPLTVRWYVTDLPFTIRQLLGIRAAKLPLATAGDLVMGAGISSRSISVDGLSQSKSTTKSSAGGAFAGRIRQLEEDEQRLLWATKAEYGRPRVIGI